MAAITDSTYQRDCISESDRTSWASGKTGQAAIEMPAPSENGLLGGGTLPGSGTEKAVKSIGQAIR
jgi:hypothetical protein